MTRKAHPGRRSSRTSASEARVQNPAAATRREQKKKRYRVELNDSARKELAALPKHVQQQVRARIDALAEDPRPHGAVRLSGSGTLDQYRIRSGDYRILYEIYEKVLLVLVVRIADRSKAYRQLDRLR